MRIVDWSGLSATDREALFEVAAQSKEVRERAVGIVDAIRYGGDEAVFRLAAELDGFEGESFLIDPSERKAALAALSPEDRKAVWSAIEAVKAFHAQQGLKEYEIETWPGIECRRKVDPIQTVGLYVPAGSAPLVSTLIMLAVPAQLAGVPNIAVVVPPGADGRVDPAVLAVAEILGLDQVFAIGGAQAIAALTFGRAGLPKADKIFGPGNAWVAAAKSYVSTLPSGPAIDLPAGPSEVMVVADGTANPEFVAADMLAQAEHDAMAQVVLVALPGLNVAGVQAALERQLASLSRAGIAASALKHGIIIASHDIEKAKEIVELACPEHLLLQLDNAEAFALNITRAGSIFVGSWTPESMGDYAAGPNHTLPTGGAGRAWSGVTVEAFQRSTTLLISSRRGALGISSTVQILAELEGLGAHKAAMQIRVEGDNV